MKKSKLKIILGTALFMLLSITCKKDTCRNLICLNGGKCIDGKCKCPEGFSGEHCDSYDLCFNVVCSNGGTCEYGECKCPPGFFGNHCDSIDLCYNLVCQGPCEKGVCLPPKIVHVTKIEVLRFPISKPMGIPWDAMIPPDNNPDIFPLIEKDSSAPWFFQPPITNALPGTSYFFTPNPPVDLIYPTSQYAIHLLDGDSPQPPEPMGKIYFVPFVQANGYPANMVIDPGGPLAFKLTLEYSW